MSYWEALRVVKQVSTRRLRHLGVTRRQTCSSIAPRRVPD